MAFNKFDPHRPEAPEKTTSADRRAWILKWLWWVSVAYTAVGFAFIAYWLLR